MPYMVEQLQLDSEKLTEEFNTFFGDIAAATNPRKLEVYLLDWPFKDISRRYWKPVVNEIASQLKSIYETHFREKKQWKVMNSQTNKKALVLLQIIQRIIMYNSPHNWFSEHVVVLDFVYCVDPQIVIEALKCLVIEKAFFFGGIRTSWKFLQDKFMLIDMLSSKFLNEEIFDFGNQLLDKVSSSNEGSITKTSSNFENGTANGITDNSKASTEAEILDNDCLAGVTSLVGTAHKRNTHGLTVNEIKYIDLDIYQAQVFDYMIKNFDIGLLKVIITLSYVASHTYKKDSSNEVPNIETLDMRLLFDFVHGISSHNQLFAISAFLCIYIQEVSQFHKFDMLLNLRNKRCFLYVLLRKAISIGSMEVLSLFYVLDSIVYEDKEEYLHVDLIIRILTLNEPADKLIGPDWLLDYGMYGTTDDAMDYKNGNALNSRSKPVNLYLRAGLFEVDKPEDLDEKLYGPRYLSLTSETVYFVSKIFVDRLVTNKKFFDRLKYQNFETFSYEYILSVPISCWKYESSIINFISAMISYHKTDSENINATSYINLLVHRNLYECLCKYNGINPIVVGKCLEAISWSLNNNPTRIDGITDFILEMLDKLNFSCFNTKCLESFVDLLNALSLNVRARQALLKQKWIHKSLFSIRDAYFLLNKQSTSSIGFKVSEFARHHPSFKKEVLKLVDDMVKYVLEIIEHSSGDRLFSTDSVVESAAITVEPVSPALENDGSSLNSGDVTASINQDTLLENGKSELTGIPPASPNVLIISNFFVFVDCILETISDHLKESNLVMNLINLILHDKFTYIYFSTKSSGFEKVLVQLFVYAKSYNKVFNFLSKKLRAKTLEYKRFGNERAKMDGVAEKNMKLFELMIYESEKMLITGSTSEHEGRLVVNNIKQVNFDSEASLCVSNNTVFDRSKGLLDKNEKPECNGHVIDCMTERNKSSRNEISSDAVKKYHKAWKKKDRSNLVKAERILLNFSKKQLLSLYRIHKILHLYYCLYLHSSSLIKITSLVNFNVFKMVLEIFYEFAPLILCLDEDDLKSPDESYYMFYKRFIKSSKDQLYKLKRFLVFGNFMVVWCLFEEFLTKEFYAQKFIEAQMPLFVVLCLKDKISRLNHQFICLLTRHKVFEAIIRQHNKALKLESRMRNLDVNDWADLMIELKNLIEMTNFAPKITSVRSPSSSTTADSSDSVGRLSNTRNALPSNKRDDVDRDDGVLSDKCNDTHTGSHFIQTLIDDDTHLLLIYNLLLSHKYIEHLSTFVFDLCISKPKHSGLHIKSALLEHLDNPFYYPSFRVMPVLKEISQFLNDRDLPQVKSILYHHFDHFTPTRYIEPYISFEYLTENCIRDRKYIILAAMVIRCHNVLRRCITLINNQLKYGDVYEDGFVHLCSVVMKLEDLRLTKLRFCYVKENSPDSCSVDLVGDVPFYDSSSANFINKHQLAMFEHNLLCYTSTDTYTTRALSTLSNLTLLDMRALHRLSREVFNTKVDIKASLNLLLGYIRLYEAIGINIPYIAFDLEKMLTRVYQSDELAVLQFVFIHLFESHDAILKKLCIAKLQNRSEEEINTYADNHEYVGYRSFSALFSLIDVGFEGSDVHGDYSNVACYNVKTETNKLDEAILPSNFNNRVLVSNNDVIGTSTLSRFNNISLERSSMLTCKHPYVYNHINHNEGYIHELIWLLHNEDCYMASLRLIVEVLKADSSYTKALHRENVLEFIYDKFICTSQRKFNSSYVENWVVSLFRTIYLSEDEELKEIAYDIIVKNMNDDTSLEKEDNASCSTDAANDDEINTTNQNSSSGVNPKSYMNDDTSNGNDKMDLIALYSAVQESPSFPAIGTSKSKLQSKSKKACSFLFSLINDSHGSDFSAQQISTWLHNKNVMNILLTKSQSSFAIAKLLKHHFASSGVTIDTSLLNEYDARENYQHEGSTDEEIMSSYWYNNEEYSSSHCSTLDSAESYTYKKSKTIMWYSEKSNTLKSYQEEYKNFKDLLNHIENKDMNYRRACIKDSFGQYVCEDPETFIFDDIDSSKSEENTNTDAAVGGDYYENDMFSFYTDENDHVQATDDVTEAPDNINVEDTNSHNINHIEGNSGHSIDNTTMDNPYSSSEFEPAPEDRQVVTAESYLEDDDYYDDYYEDSYSDHGSIDIQILDNNRSETAGSAMDRNGLEVNEDVGLGDFCAKKCTDSQVEAVYDAEMGNDEDYSARLKGSYAELLRQNTIGNFVAISYGINYTLHSYGFSKYEEVVDKPANDEEKSINEAINRDKCLTTLGSSQEDLSTHTALLPKNVGSSGDISTAHLTSSTAKKYTYSLLRYGVRPISSITDDDTFKRLSMGIPCTDSLGSCNNNRLNSCIGDLKMLEKFVKPEKNGLDDSFLHSKLNYYADALFMSLMSIFKCYAKYYAINTKEKKREESMSEEIFGVENGEIPSLDPDDLNNMPEDDLDAVITEWFRNRREVAAEYRPLDINFYNRLNSNVREMFEDEEIMHKKQFMKSQRNNIIDLHINHSSLLSYVVNLIRHGNNDGNKIARTDKENILHLMQDGELCKVIVNGIICYGNILLYYRDLRSSRVDHEECNSVVSLLCKSIVPKCSCIPKEDVSELNENGETYLSSKHLCSLVALQSCYDRCIWCMNRKLHCELPGDYSNSIDREFNRYFKCMLNLLHKLVLASPESVGVLYNAPGLVHFLLECVDMDRNASIHLLYTVSTLINKPCKLITKQDSEKEAVKNRDELDHTHFPDDYIPDSDHNDTSLYNDKQQFAQSSCVSSSDDPLQGRNTQEVAGFVPYASKSFGIVSNSRTLAQVVDKPRQVMNNDEEEVVHTDVSNDLLLVNALSHHLDKVLCLLDLSPVHESRMKLQRFLKNTLLYFSSDYYKCLIMHVLEDLNVMSQCIDMPWFSIITSDMQVMMVRLFNYLDLVMGNMNMEDTKNSVEDFIHTGVFNSETSTNTPPVTVHADNLSFYLKPSADKLNLLMKVISHSIWHKITSTLQTKCLIEDIDGVICLYELLFLLERIASKMYKCLNFDNSAKVLLSNDGIYKEEDHLTLNMAIWEYERLYSDFIAMFNTFLTLNSKQLTLLANEHPELLTSSLKKLISHSIMEFNTKVKYLRNMIDQHYYNSESSFTIVVNRNTILHDSYFQIMARSAKTFKRQKMHIKFSNEAGLDYGGLTREWLELLIRELLNPNYALFAYSSEEKTTVIPSESSAVNPEHLGFYRFVGRILAKCILCNQCVDLHLTRVAYKYFLERKIGLSDLEYVDPAYYQSLMWIRDNHIGGDEANSKATYDGNLNPMFDFTFSMEFRNLGIAKMIDLIENGSKTKVTDSNKHEYIKLVCEYKLYKGIERQLKAIKEGLYEIIDKKLIGIFNERELELLLCGVPEINVEDWRTNTEYYGYSATSVQVIWFWQAVSDFSSENRAKMLQFVTGTSRLPLQGFSNLQGSNGMQKFNIHRRSGVRLPSAHTCFNQLDLPEYESYEDLVKYLLMAISECNTGFEMI